LNNIFDEISRRTPWIGPCFGLGIANFGLQVVTTVLITYCVDCYSSHPFLVTQFINIVRQLISFTVPFWNPNLNEKVGYDLGFGIEAIIAVFFYFLVCQSQLHCGKLLT
jgi:Na+/melibiose symporter-like transporter